LDKNGHLFILDRTDGQFVRAVKFTETTWGDVDPNTGNITVRLVPTPEGVEIKPGRSEGKEGFPHAAYSRQTGYLYVPVIDNTATYPATGREVWSWQAKYPMAGSVLATAGGLVFSGEPDGHFNAIPSGWGGWLAGIAPNTMGAPRRDALYVFALP
jgi:alcohol dehydrogenase (cytochrome c)